MKSYLLSLTASWVAPPCSSRVAVEVGFGPEFARRAPISDAIVRRLAHRSSIGPSPGRDRVLVRQLPVVAEAEEVL